MLYLIEQKTIYKEFEKVFGYEYYEKNFEPKLFIEEVSNIIKRKYKNTVIVYNINNCIIYIYFSSINCNL